MTWSQDYWKPLKILWRFGFIPLVIAALLHIWIIVLVGPVLCLTTWALKKYQKSLPVVPKIFNWWEDYWECCIGAFSAIGINTAIFFGNIDYILNWSFK